MPPIPMSADTSPLSRRRHLTILTAEHSRCVDISAVPLALLTWVNDKCYYSTHGATTLGMRNSFRARCLQGRQQRQFLRQVSQNRDSQFGPRREFYARSLL